MKSFQKVGSETIEHIYPQNPTQEYWMEKKLAPHGNAKRLANSYKNSLGNLLLLSQSKNATLQNYAFPEKRKLYREGSFSENEVAERYRTWGPNQIVKRGVSLLKFAEERWEFSFKADWGINYRDCLVLKES